MIRPPIDFDSGLVDIDNEVPMEVTLAVLADYANVSREGKLNILGVFGEVNPPVLPWRLPQMYLVISMKFQPAETMAEVPLKVVLWEADGDERLSLEQNIPVPTQRGERTVNQIVGLAGLRFDKAGNYTFRILVSGEERRVLPFRVNEPPPENDAGREE